MRAVLVPEHVNILVQTTEANDNVELPAWMIAASAGEIRVAA